MRIATFVNLSDLMRVLRKYKNRPSQLNGGVILEQLAALQKAPLPERCNNTSYLCFAEPLTWNGEPLVSTPAGIHAVTNVAASDALPSSDRNR